MTIDPVAQQAYLKAFNTGGNDAFGLSVSVSGDTVVVGSQETGTGGFEGAAHVFVRSGAGWIQHAYLKASNAAWQHYFGNSVAVSGNTVVVGARYENNSATGVDGDQHNGWSFISGAAYVFVRNGPLWSQQAYLKASNTEPLTIYPASGDQFGSSVSASGDTIVVGAVSEDSHATGVNGDQSSNSATGSGAAYVFVRNGTTWSQQAYLKASNTEPGDVFGSSVSVSGDTVAIGAPQEDSNTTGVDGDQGNNDATTSGAVYVFVRNGTIWSQQAYLKASNAEALDGFGSRVSVSGDTLVVGAPGEDSDATGIGGDQSSNSAPGSGAAYVFVRNGTTWSQQAYLKASNTEQGDVFGSSVSVSGDTAVVGAGGEDSNAIGVNGDTNDNTASSSGAAYMFVRNGTGWSQQAYLKASNAESGDAFRYVSVSDGTVVVGAPGEDSQATTVNGDQGSNSYTSAGAAYVFRAPSLAGDVGAISLASGGTQTLMLDAGTGHALEFYWLLSTTAGTSPGLPLGMFTVPLNLSGLLKLTAQSPDSLVQNSMNLLDSNGQMTATMTLAAGLDRGLAGVTLHHACMLMEPMNYTITFVSNPVPLTLIP